MKARALAIIAPAHLHVFEFKYPGTVGHSLAEKSGRVKFREMYFKLKTGRSAA